MDKYEYKVKLDQIEKLAAKKDYVTAAKIADGIDWRKIKSVSTLTMIADIYEASNRLEDCYELLNMVYDRSPIGRRVVYRLAEVATRMHDFEEAIELYKEFVRIAPRDLNKYILKYQIYRERGSAITDQIDILEEYKNCEYDERWAYELACLYEEAGQIDRCVEECDELILWFSEGEYVVKAMELKRKYQELTATQQEKYEHRFDYLEKEAAEAQDFDEEDAEEPDAETVSEEAEASEAMAEDSFEMPVQEDDKTEPEEAKVETEEIPQESAEEAQEEDDTPTVSVINTNKFSTINLQEELARGIQEFLGEESLEEEESPKAVTQEFIPVKEIPVVTVIEPGKDTGEMAVEEAASEPEAVEEPEEAVIESEAVEEPEETVSEPEAAEVPEETEEAVSEPETAVEPEEAKKAPLSETAEIQNEILKYVAVKQEPKMEDYLHTEEDGQLSLALDGEHALEKQITGQMTIEEILEAWEEKKRQARELIANAESKKQAVPFETGEITNLLEDFIPKTPKDVLELIEDIEGKTTVEETAEEVVETKAEDTFAEEPEVEELEATEEPETVEEELEDDLPMDIDLADVLEAALQEPEEEETPKEITEEPVKPKEEPRGGYVGENTASMLDAIERALALEITPLETSGKYLTEEQEKIFAYFTSVSGMKKQLLNLLNEEHLYVGKTDSKEGNLIITGHPGNGKTTLAIDIVKAFQKQRREKGGKLAKVTGDGLNKKDPADVVKKLGGGALIIERAGSLKDEIVEKLSEAMEGTTGGLLVILEDDLKEINKLMEKHAGFAAKFTRSVDIPIFSNDELVAFGKSYAEEKEYYFEEMAVLALYDCIGVRQTSDHVVNITEVKEFVDDAIAHAEKKSKGLFVRLSKKRIDEYGNKLLLEEDFDY